MPPPSSKSPDLVERMLKGDKRALARLMTYVDNQHEDLMSLMARVHEHAGKAQRIGITGPPGAGKSTLVDKLIRTFRDQGKKVGVVAIDPSSPFTGGAVLGDRIRMMEHSVDDGVFIRSLGTRGSHGGLSRATREIVTLYDAFGFDIVLVETVGVGQTELDIMSVAHSTVVVVVPESGDTIQTMKAGLMEIADIFVVNKGDREGADRMMMELTSLAEIQHTSWMIPVIKTVAVKSEGVIELVEALGRHFAHVKSDKNETASKSAWLKDEAIELFLWNLKLKVKKDLDPNGLYAKEYASLVDDHHNPYRTAVALAPLLNKK